jgi:hypothetical protein
MASHKITKSILFHFPEAMVLASVSSKNETSAARLAGHPWPKVRMDIPVCVFKPKTRTVQISQTHICAR